MSKNTPHKQGSFCWIDLGTTDAASAKNFYGALFGWTFVDLPTGGGGTYTMCKLEGADAAAFYELGPEQAGVSPHWMTYIAVDDVDQMSARAREFGATILKAPFDVMEVGRMAVLQDPSGATISFWQGKQHFGVGTTREPGSLCWSELFSTNPTKAGAFYAKTLEWETSSHDMGPMGTYTLFSRAGEGKQGQIGGMMAMPPHMAGVPSHWLTYFAVADVDASAAQVAELGGKVVMPPQDIPNIGRFAIAQDPGGASFALYKNAH